MRFALWLIGLFAVATALALFAGSDPGTVTVFWPPYRVDVSLNLTLLLLSIAFVLLYLALRALAKLLALPRQAERWRAQHRARAQHAALLDAWSRLNAGQPGRAATAARAVLTQLAVAPTATGDAADRQEAALQHARLRTAAHWLLAHSAHARGELLYRDQALVAAQAESAAASPADLRSWHDAVRLQAAEWAIDARQQQQDADRVQKLLTQQTGSIDGIDGAAALSKPKGGGVWLDERPPTPRAPSDNPTAFAAWPPALARRIAARRLRLRAATLEGRTLDALQQARQLARHRVLPEAAERRRQLILAHLQAADNDAASKRHAWSDLDASERALVSADMAHVQTGQRPPERDA